MKIACDLVTDKSGINLSQYCNKECPPRVILQVPCNKGKTLGYKGDKKMYKQCRLSTDVPLIHVPHWYLTNGWPIHCQHTTDAIMTKSKKTNRKTPLGKYIGWFLSWHRTGIAIYISTYSLPRCRPDTLVEYLLTHPIRHMIHGL